MKIINNIVTKKNRLLLLFFCLTLLITSCKHEVDMSGIPEISFSGDIQLILASNCTMSGCHSTDATSEFSLTTYNDVIENGDIRPGDANDSKLYEVILETGDDRMPPTGSLTEIQIKKIFIWIEQGAKNN